MTKNATRDIKAQLEQLIKHGNPNWNISPNTAAYIVSLLRTIRPITTLEIGTSTGYSAICIAEALSEWNGSLITVESHKKRFEMAHSHIKASGLTNITQVLGHAPEILKEIPGTFNTVFFDATKYEHLSYFEALKDRLRPGGLMITDNVLSHEQALCVYRKTIESDTAFTNELIDIGAGLLVSRKIK